jgi:hypothetical protein
VTQEKNLQIVVATVAEEEEEDPSSTCGGYRRRRRRGESGVVSNSCCNSNDNNNLGIPTIITTVATGRARVGAGTGAEVGTTGVDGSGSHEFHLQWLTSQQ